MKLGIPNSTHAKLHGVEAPRILKLLAQGEQERFHPYWTLRRSDRGWIGGGEQPIEVVDVRDKVVLAPGDVIRVRPGSSAVSVLWRRGAKSNALFATERCNSLCLMCSQPPRDVDDRWRLREMLEVISLVDRDAPHIGITGGEPTLLGDGLIEVLDACRLQLPGTKIHILTNGRTFKDEIMAARFVAAGGQNATWGVPLYADVPDIHDEVVASEGAFDETLDGFFELAKFRAKVEVRVVLHALTIPRLRQLAAFIYRRLPFVEHVALMGLEPMGFAKGNRQRLWIDPADYVSELWDAVAFLTNRGLNVSIYNLQLCLLPRALWPFARQSISEWKNRYVDTCSGCLVRDHCAGFFASAGSNWRSRDIHPIRLEELNNAVA